MKISSPVSRILATGALAAFLIVPTFAQTGAKPPKTTATPPASAAKTTVTASGKSKMASHKTSVRHAAHRVGKTSKLAPAKKSH